MLIKRNPIIQKYKNLVGSSSSSTLIKPVAEIDRNIYIRDEWDNEQKGEIQKVPYYIGDIMDYLKQK